MTQAEWKPRLALSASVKAECGEIARPYHGKTRPIGLCRKLRAAIASRYPDHEIKVTNFTRPLDRHLKLIRVLVTVDGKADQGMIFGLTGSAPLQVG